MGRTITLSVKAALFTTVLVVCGLSAKAQQFSQTAPYDTLETESDTLDWYITSPVIDGAWGTVTVTLYYEGDFGDESEYFRIYGENNSLLGITLPHIDGDCLADSAQVTFPATFLSSWGADNSIHIYAVSSEEVNIICTANHATIKMEYNYCPLGGPVASLELPATSFCAVDDAVAFTATPAGGILSGPGLSATEFDPSGLSEGNHTLTYTVENEDGCETSSEFVVFIKRLAFATADDYTICPQETVTLSTPAKGHVQWFLDAAATDSVGAGSPFSITVPETTTFYAGVVLNEVYFTIDEFGVTDSLAVDIDTLAGDDRGGIAVTQEYIYITGDDSTVRYDLDLQNPVTYETTEDAFFSDLGTGQLYTLSHAVNGAPDYEQGNGAYINQIITLNDDLTPGATTIILSDSIYFGIDEYENYQSGIFAGNGFVMIYSAQDSTFYAIDLGDGTVTDLGYYDPSVLNAYWSENIAFWGIAEFTENGYNALYSDNNSPSIKRLEIATGIITTAAAFEDMNDMANFAYSPWNNRWYFHYEGGGQFDPEGDIYELLGYAASGDSTGVMTYGGLIGCPAEVIITVNSTPIELTGAGASCIGDPAIALTATPAGGTFSGTGVTGNSFNPTTAGMGTHTVLYTYMDAVTQCENYDSLVYVVDCFVGLEEQTTAQIGLYPNPAKEIMNIDLGTMNSATVTFRVFDAAGRLMLTQQSDGTSLQQLDVSTLGQGTYLLHVSGDTEARKLFAVSK